MFTWDIQASFFFFQVIPFPALSFVHYRPADRQDVSRTISCRETERLSGLLWRSVRHYLITCMQCKPTGLLLLGCSDSNGCNRNLAGNDAPKKTTQQTCSSSSYLLMMVGWSIIMKDLVRPPLLHLASVEHIYWLMWRLVYSQDLFVVLIALMFLVRNSEHQILQRPARLRECVGEWLGSLREYFWFLFKFKGKIKGARDEIEIQFKVSFRECIKAQILLCLWNSRMERVQRHRLRVFESLMTNGKNFSSCWKLAAG